MIPQPPWTAQNPMPAPGSAEAALLGCECDPVANHYGTGDGCRTDDGFPMWLASLNCPFHLVLSEDLRDIDDMLEVTDIDV